MNKIILITVIVLIGLSPAYYGQEMERGNRRPPIEKIEQLERAKLIELLDLNEDAAVRFFVRRKEFREKLRELIDQRENLINKIEKKLKDEVDQSDKEYKDQLNELFSHDMKIVQHKEQFLNSLNDILTPEQVLKLAVFDNRFMREIRELLMQRKKNH